MSQDPSSMYLSVIISGNQAFEIPLHLYASSISVIQSTYSFLSTQRRSFQPVCYIGATTFMAAPGDLQNTQESVGYNQQGQWTHRATRRGEV